MSAGQSHVWYVGYGSNLCKERFFCYINGGKFKWGGSHANGCTDKSAPESNKQIRIPHRLYFAKDSSNWANGGVAFVDSKRELDESEWTWGRMWKITYEQYAEVKVQEGPTWYDYEIDLGEQDGLPIRTITNRRVLMPYTRPSDEYSKTIALGLKETYDFTTEQITKYLIEKSGIKGSITEDELRTIIQSIG